MPLATWLGCRQSQIGISSLRHFIYDVLEGSSKAWRGNRFLTTFLSRAHVSTSHDFKLCYLPKSEPSQEMQIAVTSRSANMQSPLTLPRAPGAPLKSVAFPDAARLKVTLRFAAQQQLRTVCKATISAPVRLSKLVNVLLWKSRFVPPSCPPSSFEDQNKRPLSNVKDIIICSST